MDPNPAPVRAQRAWSLILVVSLGLALTTVWTMEGQGAVGIPTRQACPSPTATPGGQTPTATPCPSPTATPTSDIECKDDIDNDGDGKIDHPADPGCENPNDDTEIDPTPSTTTPGPTTPPATTPAPTVTTTVTTPPTPTPGPAQCDDGIDNDGDGKIDHPADPECDNKNDNSEAVPTTVTPVPSVISIQHKLRPRHRFKGSVSATETACVAGRRVVVKKVRSGADRRVGRALVGDNGNWGVRHRRGGGGRYYAVVKASVVGSFDCRRARSSTIRVRR